MQEQHRLAVRADLGVAVAEHARAFGFQLVAGAKNIVDLVADVMDAAVRIAFEEFGDRRVLAERLEQLDLGVRQVMNTVFTPWSGCGTTPDTSAPSVSL